MKHIFLTGDIGIGKSSVIQRALDPINVDPGGFQTYFGHDQAAVNRQLYIGWAG